MRIAVIETGAPPPALKDRHGGYPAMMQRLLGPHLPGADWRVARVFEGEAPPPVGGFDAMLIAGSPAGVYDDEPWIAPLEDLVRRAAANGKPQVGICFGHQLLAQAFGGEVVKSDKGWGVGVHEYRIEGEAPWMRPAQSRIACVVSHQDQVVAPPPGARRLGGSDFCPNGVLAYAQGPAISFQMHPEFDHGFAADLLRAREGRIARPLIDDALASLSRASDRDVLARWIAQFFKSA